MVKKEKFCCIDNFGVLIPYTDLQKLMSFANSVELFEKRLSHMDGQLQALRGLYSDVLEKVGELERNI